MVIERTYGNVEPVKMHAQKPSPPSGTVDLIADKSELAFFDTQSLKLPYQMSAFEAWTLVMADALPLMKTAFALRDAVSACFGVKRIVGFSGTAKSPPIKGGHLDFFLVERSEVNILTLTARDTHLDVMTCVTTTDMTLSITSSVVTHNTFGKVYMLPVAPAHRFIVRTMLRRLARSLAEATA